MAFIKGFGAYTLNTLVAPKNGAEGGLPKTNTVVPTSKMSLQLSTNQKNKTGRTYNWDGTKNRAWGCLAFFICWFFFSITTAQMFCRSSTESKTNRAAWGCVKKRGGGRGGETDFFVIRAVWRLTGVFFIRT